MIANQIPKLTNIRRRNKAAGNQIVFEDIGNPLGIFLVGFLTPNRLDILGVCQNDFAVCFKDIVDGNPILSRRFHTNILTVTCQKPR